MDDFESHLTTCWMLQNLAVEEWLVQEVQVNLVKRHAAEAAETVEGQLVVLSAMREGP